MEKLCKVVRYEYTAPCIVFNMELCDENSCPIDRIFTEIIRCPIIGCFKNQTTTTTTTITTTATTTTTTTTTTMRKTTIATITMTATPMRTTITTTTTITETKTKTTLGLNVGVTIPTIFLTTLGIKNDTSRKVSNIISEKYDTTNKQFRQKTSTEIIKDKPKSIFIKTKNKYRQATSDKLATTFEHKRVRRSTLFNGISTVNSGTRYIYVIS